MHFGLCREQEPMLQSVNSIPALAKEAQTAQNRQLGEEESVCEYDKDVIPLFRAIEKKSWEAIKHFFATGYWKGSLFPDPISPRMQARTWVSQYEDNDENRELIWSQLPIHAAITHDAPKDVIEVLVDAYPDSLHSCNEVLMLPVHLAFRSGSSDDILALFVSEFPEGLTFRDIDGRLPADCAKIGPNPQRGIIIDAILEEYKIMCGDQLPGGISNLNKRGQKRTKCIETLKGKLAVLEKLNDELMETKKESSKRKKEWACTMNTLSKALQAGKDPPLTVVHAHEEKAIVKQLVDKLSDIEKAKEDLAVKEELVKYQLHQTVSQLQVLRGEIALYCPELVEEVDKTTHVFDCFDHKPKNSHSGSQYTTDRSESSTYETRNKKGGKSSIAERDDHHSLDSAREVRVENQRSQRRSDNRATHNRSRNETSTTNKYKVPTGEESSINEKIAFYIPELVEDMDVEGNTNLTYRRSKNAPEAQDIENEELSSEKKRKMANLFGVNTKKHQNDKDTDDAEDTEQTIGDTDDDDVFNYKKDKKILSKERKKTRGRDSVRSNRSGRSKKSQGSMSKNSEASYETDRPDRFDTSSKSVTTDSPQEMIDQSERTTGNPVLRSHGTATSSLVKALTQQTVVHGNHRPNVPKKTEVKSERSSKSARRTSLEEAVRRKSNSRIRTTKDDPQINSAVKSTSSVRTGKSDPKGRYTPTLAERSPKKGECDSLLAKEITYKKKETKSIRSTAALR